LPQRKRRRTRTSSRERILDASIAVFADDGYAGASTRALAAAAKVNIATLAYHFKGKEGLYRAAIARLYERLLALEPIMGFFEGPPRACVELLVRAIYRFMRDHQKEIRLLQRHVLDHGGLLPEPVRERYGPELFARARRLLGVIGVTPSANWRLDLQALAFIMARSAITDAKDLASFVPADRARNPHAAVEDHLCELAARVLSV
jgi:AcrR family transcriptional regulator